MPKRFQVVITAIVEFLKSIFQLMFDPFGQVSCPKCGGHLVTTQFQVLPSVIGNGLNLLAHVGLKVKWRSWLVDGIIEIALLNTYL